MVEKKHIVFDLRLNYNGPLSIEKFYEEVEKWMNEKGLQKDLKRKSEDVSPKGKKIEWTIECWKALTTEHKHEVRLRALFDKIKEEGISITTFISMPKSLKNLDTGEKYKLNETGTDFEKI